jgi:hypothetical protein
MRKAADGDRAITSLTLSGFRKTINRLEKAATDYIERATSIGEVNDSTEGPTMPST